MFPQGQGLGTWGPITMSNAIDSRPPEGTHCEGGRVKVDVQLATYEDQLRHDRSISSRELRRGNNVIALIRNLSLTCLACTYE
jgi:hypothetical protein